MELSELGLSEEQWAGVEAYAAGLKAKNDELLGEKKAEQQKAIAANEATEAARLEASKAKELELIASGKTEELKAHYEAQLAEGTAAQKLLTEKAVNALKDRDKGSVISSILNNVDDRYKSFVETQLNNSVSISYSDDGKAVASIKDGDASYASSTDFLNGVKESEAWKHVLKATSLSGAGTKQTVNGSGNAAQETTQTRLGNRLKVAGLTQ